MADLLAIIALDPSGNPAGTGVVGHQHEIAAGQADEGGEGGALAAALFLVHLDDYFLAFAYQILDTLASRLLLQKIFPGNFLEGQKTVALGPIIHKGGFQARFYPGDPAFVNVAFLLFAVGPFNIEVEQFLAVHQGYPQLLGVRGVDQHPFHKFFVLRRSTQPFDLASMLGSAAHIFEICSALLPVSCSGSGSRPEASAKSLGRNICHKRIQSQSKSCSRGKLRWPKRECANGR